MMGLLEMLGFRSGKKADAEVVEEQAVRKKRRTTLVRAQRIIDGERPHEAKVNAALTEMDKDNEEAQQTFNATINGLDAELQELLREEEERQGRPETAAD